LSARFQGGRHQLAKGSNPAFLRLCLQRVRACFFCTGAAAVLSACGGSSYTAHPITLSVSLSNPTVTLSQDSSVSIPVVVVAPTETVTFTIQGLPAGVTQSYKESESNPSGLLTLYANASTKPGTYQSMMVVGSSGQTAAQVFTLVITAMNKGQEDSLLSP
jgi:hypothetical protein